MHPLFQPLSLATRQEIYLQLVAEPPESRRAEDPILKGAWIEYGLLEQADETFAHLINRLYRRVYTLHWTSVEAFQDAYTQFLRRWRALEHPSDACLALLGLLPDDAVADQESTEPLDDVVRQIVHDIYVARLLDRDVGAWILTQLYPKHQEHP